MLKKYFCISKQRIPSGKGRVKIKQLKSKKCYSSIRWTLFSFIDSIVHPKYTIQSFLAPNNSTPFHRVLRVFVGRFLHLSHSHDNPWWHGENSHWTCTNSSANAKLHPSRIRFRSSSPRPFLCLCRRDKLKVGN